MLLAGSPATTIANHRLYAFFVDDLVRDPVVPFAGVVEHRWTCSTTGDGLSPSCAMLPRGGLCWAAIDNFSVPASETRSAACALPNVDCVTPTNHQVGNARGRQHGATNVVERRFHHGIDVALVSTTISDGGTTKVIVAWTLRVSGAL
jgi:hypothetical protein